MKGQILRETLERAHLTEIPAIAVVQGEPLGYRNRIRLHVDRASSMLCYKRRGSHANLPVDVCLIARAAALEGALKTVQSNSKQWLGTSFDEMEFFTNAEQSSILLTLWSSREAKAAQEDLRQLWPQLVNAIPEIVGAAVLSSERGKQTGTVLAQTGEQALVYKAAGHDYRVGLGSCFKVNRFRIDSLVDRGVGDRSGERAWDLYAPG